MRWLHWGILPNIQRKLTVILFKLFQKIKEKETLPNSFYEANITLILKPDKDFTKKEYSPKIFDEYLYKNQH